MLCAMGQHRDVIMGYQAPSVGVGKWRDGDSTAQTPRAGCVPWQTHTSGLNIELDHGCSSRQSSFGAVKLLALMPAWSMPDLGRAISSNATLMEKLGCLEEMAFPSSNSSHLAVLLSKPYSPQLLTFPFLPKFQLSHCVQARSTSSWHHLLCG